MVEITKREILKACIISGIVISTVIVVYGILPMYMDTEPAPMKYHGNPAYACTEAFQISTCLNKTNMDSYVWSNNGHIVTDIGFKLEPDMKP